MSEPTSVDTSKVSYSRVIQQSKFPTRHQAIIVDAIEGVSIQEYIFQLYKVTDPQSIRFISRIFYGRVCGYLDTKENADKLMENSIKITIGSHSLAIRPLLPKSRRIIFSNVCPV